MSKRTRTPGLPSMPPMYGPDLADVRDVLDWLAAAEVLRASIHECLGADNDRA